MYCPTTIMLFYKYPRPIHVMYVGKHVRKVIAQSPAHLFLIMDEYPAELHTPLHVTEGEINKVVFDIDHESLEVSLNEVKELCSFLRKEGLPYIPVYTGGKGFHVYVMFKPFHSNRDTVRLAYKGFYEYVVDSVGLKYYDENFVRSTIHTVRIPLSRRLIPSPLGNIVRFCTYLSADVERLTVEDVLKESFRPTCRTYDIRDLPDIRGYLGYQPSYAEHVADPFEVEKLPASMRVLSKLVRPCVLHHVRRPDAPHEVRTAFACELAWLGFDEDVIAYYCRMMGWDDYNPRVTRYHVKRIWWKVRNKQLFPPSCKRLKFLGYCLGEKCPYYPGVFYWWGVI